jgi:hypothetical protein
MKAAAWRGIGDIRRAVLSTVAGLALAGALLCRRDLGAPAGAPADPAVDVAGWARRRPALRYGSVDKEAPRWSSSPPRLRPAGR